MTQSNDSQKRALLTLAVTTAIAAVVAVWNLHGGEATDSFAPGHDRGNAIADSSPVTSATTAGRARITSKSSQAMLASRAPLPPPGSPLAQIYGGLKRRADAGDAGAATRLFHEVHRCVAVRRTRRLLAEIPSAVLSADQQGDSAVVVMHASEAPEIRMVREMTDYVQSNSARCDGATDAQLNSFTPLTLQAAQLGDLKALDCYVGTDFDMMEGLLDHPEWMDQYRAQVPGLVESALQRGDWVVVDLLHHAYSGAFDTSARGQLFGIDPVMDYRLLRLEQLGATGAFADKLAPMVAAAAKALSPMQAADAETWASDHYARYFDSASNEVANGANICQIDDD
jgi:hypothetical protein